MGILRRLQGDARADRRYADRAYWPVLGDQQPPVGDVDVPSHRVSGPARSSPVAPLIRGNCGRATLRRSWWVALAPGDPRTHPALAVDYVLLERAGHWLLWFRSP